MKKMAATDDRAIDAVCGSQLDFSGKAGAPQVGETLPVRTSSQSASQTAHVQNSSVKSSDGQIELPKKLELRECCREAFGKITDYVNGELSATLEDYTLLENLNQMTTNKYAEMSNMAKVLTVAVEELNGKYKGLQPYLDQIDKLEESVASLEQAAYRLDAYSKKLETKFKKLERR